MINTSEVNTFEELRKKLAENEANPFTGGKDSESNKVLRELAEAFARQVGFANLAEAAGPVPKDLIINEETQALYNRFKVVAKRDIFSTSKRILPQA